MKKLRSVISYQLSVISLLFTVLAFSAFAQTPSETPPPPSESPTLTIPEVREMTLPNGLKVVVVQKRGLPLVTVSMLVKSGADSESEIRAGLASMTADLLIKGTEYRTATDIAEQIDFLGGSLNSGSDWDSSTVTLNVMSDKLGRALSIMSASVIRPTFPAKEVKLAKKQTLDGFNVSLKQPGALLSYISSRYTFGEHLSGGTPQSINRIQRRDILSFHTENYLPSNSVLIFTGDISDKQAFRFAKLFFSSWQNKIEPRSSETVTLSKRQLVPTLIGKTDGKEIKDPIIDDILVIDLPNSGQTAVGYTKKLARGRIDCAGVSETSFNCFSSDIYNSANVLNSVLGGGYSSRLNQEIRLKRGLSYGARSGFDWRGFESNFSATTQTKNESAGEVAELIKIEIDKLANESITDSELVPRKAVITGGFGRGLQTNNGLASRLRDLYLYELKSDELNSFMGNINKVSDLEIKNFAKSNLLGGNMIIVGDSSMFMDDLKKRFPNKQIKVIKASKLNLNKSTLQ